MRNYRLIVGTAIVLTASPALAGRPHGHGSSGGGAVANGLLGGAHRTRAERAAGTAGNCLCHQVSGLLGSRGSAQGIGRIPLNAGNVTMVTTSVIGVRGLGIGRGRRGGAIGLAGIVAGPGYGVAGVGGSSLAGSSTSAGGSTHYGYGKHGSALVNVSVANATGAMAGRVVNVAILNGHGSHRPSDVNVSALNGSAGSSGKLANVSILNRHATRGSSGVNVAVLNGTAANSGRIVNLAVLNGSKGRQHGRRGSGANSGLAAGVRLINGVPCLPDGTPLTGASAVSALAAISHPGSNTGGHGHHRSSTPANGSQSASASPAPASSGGTQVASNQGPREHAYERDRPDLWWHPGNTNVNQPGRLYDH